MNDDFYNELNKLTSDQKKISETLMPGYSKDIEKIIDQIIASAKTRFNYEQLLTAFSEYGEENAENLADYLLRAIVIEFGLSLDYDEGIENCVSRLKEVNSPMSYDQIKLVTDQIIQVTKKELGAIQKLKNLTENFVPVETIIVKLKKEIEIMTDEFGDII